MTSYNNVPSIRRQVGRPRNTDNRTELDDAVVERLLGGDREVRASWWELDAAIVQLESRGLGASDVAHRLGITNGTVHKHRARRRILMEG